jgi:hypothetical protein
MLVSINRRAEMKLAVIGTIAGLGLAAVGTAGPAEAQCWWTGLGYSCAAPSYSYPYYYPYNGYGYQNWSQRYGAPYYNDKPAWVPSYPGPRPS